MYQIADIKQHPQLEAWDQELTFLTRKVRADQKRIQEEVEVLQKEANAKHEEVWKKIEDYIVENNLVTSDYVKGEEDIGFSKKHKTLIYKGKRQDEEPHPLEMLRRLLT